MNAAVAAGTPAAEMAVGYDSVWLDFTKGLGAPLGAVLCGSAEFIDAAWRWKQRLGGSMRQAGICAAACLYSLDHHVERLAEDHANAKRFAAGLAQVPGFQVQTPETNLVFFEPSGAGITAEALSAKARARGIAFSVMGPRGRACMHLDVDRAGVDEAVGVIREIVGN
jgi:threonine aldolase